MSDVFREYEKDRAKKYQDLKSQVDILSTKVEKIERLRDQ